MGIKSYLKDKLECWAAPAYKYTYWDEHGENSLDSSEICIDQFNDMFNSMKELDGCRRIEFYRYGVFTGCMYSFSDDAFSEAKERARELLAENLAINKEIDNMLINKRLRLKEEEKLRIIGIIDERLSELGLLRRLKNGRQNIKRARIGSNESTSNRGKPKRNYTKKSIDTCRAI